MTVTSLSRWLWSRPALVLGWMMLVSGANSVAARLAIGAVSPLVLVFLRWSIVCLTLTLLLKRDERHELRRLARDHWPRLAWMGLFGFAGFNALFYVAAYRTSAVNLSLLQSASPAFVLVGAVVLLGSRIGALQIVGLLLTFLGVLIVSAKGDPGRLADLRLGTGDAFVLFACLLFAGYTLGLRTRPAGTPLVFFAGTAIASMLWASPMAAAEIVSGHAYWPSPKGWLVTLFIAYGPSFSGQICYMRGVDLIGPARAGLFVNLIPVFGALAAVVILREPFTAAHALALLLGIGGIWLAEWASLRAARRSRQIAEPSGEPRLP